MDKIIINVLLFGSIKTFLGHKLNVELAEGDRISELKAALLKVNPECNAVLDICKFAVDLTVVDDDYQLTKSGEIAVMPPFSGG